MHNYLVTVPGAAVSNSEINATNIRSYVN